MIETLNIVRRDDLLEIVLNDPANGNTLTADMAQALEEALASVTAETKLVVLRAEGVDFCRGRKSPPIDRATATAMAFRRTIAEGPLRLYAALRDCRAPTLALVQGQALGVGCALAALCDITVAAEDAVFAIPELNHGIPPTLVISALADRIGPKALSYLVLTRRRIPAQRALEIGLISDMVSPGALAGEGEALKDLLLQAGAMTLQGVKEYLTHVGSLQSPAREALAANLIATIQASQNR